MAKITQPRTYDYEGWSAVLGDRQSARIGHNTTLERRSTAFFPADPTREAADAIAVRLHSTDVVTFFADGRIMLNSGGWQSVTTKQRMNAVLPQRFRVFAKDFAWSVSDSQGTPYAVRSFDDGMILA
jgi:hypothetical protein